MVLCLRSVGLYIYKSVSMYVCVRFYVCLFVFFVCLYICAYVRTYASMYIYVCIGLVCSVGVGACMHISKYVYMCARIYTCRDESVSLYLRSVGVGECVRVG